MHVHRMHYIIIIIIIIVIIICFDTELSWIADACNGI
jgi:hypothetical protein